MIRKLLFVFSCVYISFAFTACGDLLRSLRQESLAADGIDPEEQDRKREQRLAEEEYKPRRLDGVSANNNPNYNLSARREYARQPASVQGEDGGSEEPAPRRFTRNDFVDSAANENSLWNGQGQNNYLFTQNRKNEVGDLVTVEVERDLRRDIQVSERPHCRRISANRKRKSIVMWRVWMGKMPPLVRRIKHKMRLRAL